MPTTLIEAIAAAMESQRISSGATPSVKTAAHGMLLEKVARIELGDFSKPFLAHRGHPKTASHFSVQCS